MLVIAFTGYIVNKFSAKRFSSNAQIAQTLGALAVGVLGNFYSRLQHGLAAAALLPAIFVQYVKPILLSKFRLAKPPLLWAYDLTVSPEFQPEEDLANFHNRVPSGLAASGSLVSGVTSANQITNQTVNGTLPRGTTTVGGGSGLGVGDVNSMVLNVGYSMVC